jgi:anthranilate/para-aminobenzoate synthase component I
MPRAPHRTPPPFGAGRRRRSAAARVVRCPSGPSALLAQLAARPYPAMAGFLGTTVVAADPVEVVTGADVWDALRIPADGAPAPLADAWIGYVGYPSDVPSPDLSGAAPPPVLARYGAVAQYFPDGHCVVWGRGRRARALARSVARYAPARAARIVPGMPPSSSLDGVAYAGRVATIVERIAAGDYSQVNLAQRLEADWSDAPIVFAERLWAAAGPASHRAYAAGPDGALVSASPERLLAIQDGLATSSPIKGTAPTGSAQALAESDKDRSEHVMIVDLVRNDLGRVACAGGVSVPRLMAPLRTGYVEHLVSDVTARLRPGVTVADALGAVFPAGSITGCPKLAAMSAISELEPAGRGPAFGSMVVAAEDGRCDASVLIRTAWLANGRAAYWSGGGVTWDSVPEDEYLEAMAKARPFLEAIGCG